VYFQDFAFFLPRDENEKRLKQYLNILLQYMMFVFNKRLNFPTYFDISIFPKRVLSAYKNICFVVSDVLYPKRRRWVGEMHGTSASVDQQRFAQCAETLKN
jgi:hypothetical protein